MEFNKEFEVLIDNISYDVYRIEGKYHGNVLYPLWVYYSDRIPFGMSPSSDSEYLIPYSPNLSNIVWQIGLHQSNQSFIKDEKLGFKSMTCVEIYANNNLVYHYHCVGGEEGVAYGLAKASSIRNRLIQHPYNFLEGEKEMGRMVYYKGLPATVRPRYNTPWEIDLKPDYSIINKDNWWSFYKIKVTELPYKMTEEEIEKSFEQFKENNLIKIGDPLEVSDINWNRVDTPIK